MAFDPARFHVMREYSRPRRATAASSNPASAMVTGSCPVIPYSCVLDQLRQNDGRCEPGNDPDRHQHQHFPHHHPDHVALKRAQRHADSDLSRAARHRVRHHAVQSDHRQQRRQKTEHGRQARDQSLRRAANWRSAPPSCAWRTPADWHPAPELSRAPRRKTDPGSSWCAHTPSFRLTIWSARYGTNI